VVEEVQEDYDEVRLQAKCLRPFLFFRKNKGEDTLTITFVYVDDGGCIGTKEIIASTLEGLSQTSLLRFWGPLKNYVGCKLIEDKANQQMSIKNPSSSRT